MLAQRQARRIPAVSRETCAIGERKTGVVAELRTGNPIGLILVVPRAPLADEAHLRERRRRRRDGRRKRHAECRHLHRYPPNPIQRPPHATVNHNAIDSTPTDLQANGEIPCSSAAAVLRRTVYVKIIASSSEIILIQNAGLW